MRIKINTPSVLKFVSKHTGRALVSAVIAVTCVSASAKDKGNRYEQVNLVSDLPDVAALQDTNLVNAWGIAFGPNTPFWISDNGTGKATVYSVTNDSQGVVHVSKLGLEVTIPGEGNVTGQVFNDTTGFHGDVFLFASEDGTISGWRNALGTTAEILATRAGAVYKGLTLATMAGSPVLLAANFSEGTVDAYGTNGTLVAQFSDPHAPAGYAPFNVQTVGGNVFVTFARQDEDKEDDVAGPGHGLIDVLNPGTGAFRRFATGSDAGGRLRDLNSPWGIAMAPASFGKHGGQLLVGNFGSGTIMAFDQRGDFKGLLIAVNHGPVKIEGLWALKFGSGARAGAAGTLYFTAGPMDESHGLFGSLAPANHDGEEEDED